MSGRDISIDALNVRRRQAVELRLSGLKLAEVASRTGLSVPTVIAAWRAFVAGGWEAVPVRPRGRRTGTGRALDRTQEAELHRLMRDGHPETYGLEGALWSEPLLRMLIGKQFDLELAPRTVRRYLEAWGIKGGEPATQLGETAPELLAEYEAQPARTRARLVSVRLHSQTLPADEGNASVFSSTLLVAQVPRGGCYWGALTDPSVGNIADFLERLERQEQRHRLWVALQGLDLSRWHDLPRWQAAHPKMLLKPVPGAGTVARPAFAVTAGKSPVSAPRQSVPQRTVFPSAAMPARRGATTTDSTHTVSTNKRRQLMHDSDYLTHLQRLEAESIHIMREVVAEAENPVMLYSVGKDSAVMLHLAMKAFYPSKPPFPLLHVDTTWKFREMYELRDRMARELGMDLLVYVNPEGEARNINPFTHGSAIHTDVMKTEALKQALDKYGFDAAFGGARRDEEKSRAKERIFSFRTAQHRWDPKNQRPELWKLYNARKHKGESIRVFPLSNWTELDIWQYIYLNDIPIVPLYFAAERPVVMRDGTLIMVDDDRMPLNEGEVPMMKKVRFRTLGCYPLTGAIESEADTLTAIIQEMLLARTSERQGRVIDHDAAASMEKKKQEGYF